MRDFFADRLHTAGYLVPESQGQVVDGRNTRAVVGVRVTDSASGHSNEDVGWTELGSFNLSILQRFAELDELNGFHEFAIGETILTTDYADFSDRLEGQSA